MREIRSTARYQRRLKTFLAKHPRLENIVAKSVGEVAAGGGHPHPLHGGLKGFYAVRISQSYRLICALEPDAVIFIDIGSHDEVY